MKLSKIQITLLFASGLWFFGEGLLGPLFAVFSQKIGGDILDITWAWALYLILSGTLYIVFGRLLRDSKHKEKAMILGYIINTICTFCYILIKTNSELLFLQVGFSVAEAISTPIWDSIFSNELELKDDSFLWGIAGGHSHIISGIAIAIGGLITFYLSFNVLFIIMGFIQLASTLIQANLLFNRK